MSRYYIQNENCVLELNPCSAEENLLIAVIQRAITDASQKNDDYPVREARAWLMSKDEDEFSFRWICSILELDRDAFIRRLTPNGRFEKRIKFRSRVKR